MNNIINKFEATDWINMIKCQAVDTIWYNLNDFLSTISLTSWITDIDWNKIHGWS